MSYHSGYGPSLADEGWGPGDADEVERERAEARERNETRTGWAYPPGMEEDQRARLHYFDHGSKSLCGKWDAPEGVTFDEAPYFNGCAACRRHVGRLKRLGPPR